MSTPRRGERSRHRGTPGDSGSPKGEIFYKRVESFEALAKRVMLQGSKDEISTFLLCYRAFISTTELGAIWIALYAENLRRESKDQQAIKLRLVDFTKRWLASETELSSTKREVVKQLLTFLQDLLEEATIDDFTFLMEDKDKGFLDFSPQKLAAQLTLKEFAIFRSTSPSEFLNDAWRLKHRHELSPHVLQLLYHTNQVSYWVSMTIAAAPKVRQRVHNLRSFIKLAQNLDSLNNFNTLFAVLIGLSHPSIASLKKTWRELPEAERDMFAKLTLLLQSSQNFKHYRFQLMVATPALLLWNIEQTCEQARLNQRERGAQEYSVIPILGDCLLKLCKYQKVAYDLPSNDDVLSYIEEIMQLDEELLSERMRVYERQLKASLGSVVLAVDFIRKKESAYSEESDDSDGMNSSEGKSQLDMSDSLPFKPPQNGNLRERDYELESLGSEEDLREGSSKSKSSSIKKNSSSDLKRERDTKSPPPNASAKKEKDSNDESKSRSSPKSYDVNMKWLKAEKSIMKQHNHIVRSPGEIKLMHERYLLFRSESLSSEFYSYVETIGFDSAEESDSFAQNLLFDLANGIGRSDAKTYSKTVGSRRDPMSLIAAGAFNLSHLGWAHVELLPGSQLGDEQTFAMVSQHSFSFEADSWLQRNGTAGRKKTMCGMSAGYSWSVFHAARVNFTDILQNSGWCSEVTGMSLVSVELTCRARGDDCCRFLMAPPGQIKFRLKEYLEEMHPSTGDLSEVSLSSFFQASNGCEGEPYSSSERRKWLVKSLTRLLIREGSEDLSQFSQRSGSSSPSGSDSDSDVTTSRLPRPDTPPCFMEGPSCDDHSDEQSYESDSSKESPLASRRGKGLESSNGGQKEGNSSAPSSPGRFTHSRSGSSTSQEFSEALDSDQDLRGARHHARTMSNPPIPISPRHLLGPAVRNDSGGRLRDDDGRVIMNGQRYVFVRAKAFSAEFYTLMRDLFGPGKESEADEYAANFLYDFGRSIGRVDYSRINTRDHIGARLTAFQFMMEDTGWGKIAITEMQYNAAQPDVFSLSFTASHSFEAVCWRKKERKSPMCIITCGYVAGFCGRCLGSDLVCAEIACAAMGDKNCKFIVSRAHSIEKFAKIYLAQNFSDSHEQSARFSNITVLSLTCPWPIAGRGDLDVALASKERPGTPSEERSKFTDSDEFLIGTRRSGTSSWMSSMFKKPAALKVRKRGKKRGGKAERSNQPEVIVALPEFVEVPRELANKLRNDIPREVPLVTLIDRSYPAIAGPNAEESEQFLNNEQGISCVSAQTISTYPRVLSLGIRQGDPICDAFSVLPFENGYVACVCDGCGWGPAPANAARVANSTVTESIRQFCTKTERLTVGDVVDHLLELIARAHNKIIEGKDDIFDSGTTAMLAGLACRVDDSQIEGCALPPAARSVAMPLISSSNWGREMAIHESGESSLVSSAETKLNPRTVRRANGPNVPNSEDKGKRWAWIGISVGDLKVFRWSSRTGRVYDISISSRTNPHDLTDCGGRLGPTLRNGHPDLANLGLAYVPCYENDVIWMVTDGVYDNLDPENDGRMPSEVGHWATDWQQLSEEETALLKRDAYISWFQQRVFNATKSADAPAASNGTAANGTSTASTGTAHTPLIPTTLPSLRDLTAKAVTYCRDLTAKSREFMEQNPGLPLPRDYKEYPGKLDHTTILSFRLSPPGASSSTTK